MFVLTMPSIPRTVEGKILNIITYISDYSPALKVVLLLLLYSFNVLILKVTFSIVEYI